MTQFSVHDAKTNLSRLIAEALAGGDVVIARGSVPVVRLVPIEPQGRRAFGSLKGRISMDERFNEPLPQDEIEGWDLA
ncbi:type II toxin-antitoxin system Phd/YefM family antitoxin [Novosphingobium sp. KACC 22771]|uniref:type II toxin-antitoxin system Phd/YefM family antitoxin n=1 Tax=Novosphingobium sp. KACC 22771 TaxID=3025670 RepID=UPI002366CC46|nr:type II toxin-antitoxin system prevent-host-death family antitoxin [Novosphingobium sp. KACC 22771]WDF75243.1 type II toxin-antitoxin system prevent-host-death family antitoxin [Novosphingobium sp. KACC 22771]